ncbi:MAG TPA: DUF2325 domain-containing protein [Polyangiaceae bacterium]|nr:DUF2325 domain-containing protein [Polyangiaceae bacterium]
MSARVRVAFVGGIDRIERQVVAFGEQLGVHVEVHNGRTGGSGTSRLASLVRRNDLVVIVTGTNSHSAVHIVKREAAKAGVPVRIVTFCGTASARALLAEAAGVAEVPAA